MHLAIHDALNALDRRSRPYALDARIQGPVSPEAAVAAAARDVLVTLIGQIPAPFPPACIQAGIASAEDDCALIGAHLCNDDPSESLDPGLDPTKAPEAE